MRDKLPLADGLEMLLHKQVPRHVFISSLLDAKVSCPKAMRNAGLATAVMFFIILKGEKMARKIFANGMRGRHPAPLWTANTLMG